MHASQVTTLLCIKTESNAGERYGRNYCCEDVWEQYGVRFRLKPFLLPSGCGEKDDPYEELSFKTDALLTKEYGVDRVDFKYIDVSSPEILEYINDVTNIVEGRLPFPYVSLNSKPLCWGLMEATDIMDKIKEKKLEEQSAAS